MRIPSHPTLLRRMTESRVRQLLARGPVLAASVVEIAKHCGRPGCHCQTGEKHVGTYLTYKLAGKTRTVYVPRDLIGEVRAWVREHRRLKKLTQEISQLAIARVAGHVRDKQRRQGRS